MNKRIILLFIIFALFVTLCAENVLLEITPSSMVYNYFYPAYIDPANPGMQPILFWLRAIETSGESDVQGYEVKLSLQWRDTMLIDELLVEPKENSPYEVLPAGGEFNFNSQQLIVEDESQYFSAINGIDFDATYCSK